MSMVSARSNFPIGLGSVSFDGKALKITLLKANQRKVFRSVHMSALQTAALPAWEELSETLRKPYDLPTRLPNVKKRTFGANQEPALNFYRDSASWCPYCQRVWIQLEEKEIPYQVEKINMRCYGDKPDWFLRMVPSGLLPVVELKGRVFTESLDIMLIIEDQFPSAKPLLPPEGTAERDASGFLLKLERQLAGAWLDRLRNRWSRPGGFEGAMDKVNSALEQSGGPYFLGKELSLVDAVYAPFLERIAASMPYWQGLTIRGTGRWPGVEAWFDAMDSRASYQAVKSDDFTITHTLEPQIGPCISLPSGAAYREKVDGKNGSWDLPLKSENTAWGMDDGSGGNGAKLEAARSLVSNHEAIVKFSLRGVKGGEKYEKWVDQGFRFVAHALVAGVENIQALPPDLPAEVAMAAIYVRDRVGVPRDLTYPAARQFRAHLNWLVKQIRS